MVGLLAVVTIRGLRRSHIPQGLTIGGMRILWWLVAVVAVATSVAPTVAPTGVPTPVTDAVLGPEPDKPAIEITPGQMAPRDQSIHECVAADGSRIYSDEPCTSAEAARAADAREHAAAEDLEASKDWICASSGPSAHLLLNAARTRDLTKPQRDALASAAFVNLRGDSQVRLGPLGSAHACIKGREVKVDPLGRILVKRAGVVRWVNDPATPQALRERCESVLRRCGGLDPGLTLRTCIEETPMCQTTPPWNDPHPCCPQECVSAFRKATRGGIAAKDAARAVFAGEGCM